MKSDITIKMARCKGCGICVAFCPKQVLALGELGKAPVANGDACIGTGDIVMKGMISMLDNLNRILDRVAVYLA